jgi:ureidoacrylate peracid hydrolase
MGGTPIAVTVEARPGPVELSPARTAVIVVDMQNDFVSAGGMFERAGIDTGPARAIVEPISAVLAAARRAGVLVLYLKMAFRADLSDAGVPDSPIWVKHIPMHVGDTVDAPDGTPSRILVRDTWNTEIIDALRPEPGDLVLYKHRYSGFFGTELDDVLRARGIDHLVVVGTTTSVCVESTVRDACFRDYHCLVLEDCTAEPIAADTARPNHVASLTVLERLFASVSDSAALVPALAAQPSAV